MTTDLDLADVTHHAQADRGGFRVIRDDSGYELLARNRNSSEWETLATTPHRHIMDFLAMGIGDLYPDKGRSINEALAAADEVWDTYRHKGGQR